MLYGGNGQLAQAPAEVVLHGVCVPLDLVFASAREHLDVAGHVLGNDWSSDHDFLVGSRVRIMQRR